MSGENTAEPKKLRRPVAELRAELLENPDVKEQARLLKVDVAAYVEKILDYAQHPDKPAQLTITPDEELKAAYPDAPTVDEIANHIEKLRTGEVAISRAHQRDGFSSAEGDERFKSALATDAAQLGAPESRKNPASASTPGNSEKKVG
ncbi:hypothetical protein MYSTI_05008 [Myxococcus stipitatus DSM 14675]|uniref:Uncharacterized protein n=1 Tax=Myxococcus stipitatus (strain DSM 14675 / JCM 12634 / Mx s8) TaxID=1278073 RepID=L7UBL3_MYXSD|nr:hypothetical protein [Myxococcus stipitatus]AGC46296.1 hypothetical protein MYSTI_05008 [Myxococcus stipitatus DSM 14675]